MFRVIRWIKYQQSAAVSVGVEVYVWTAVVHPAGISTGLELTEIPKEWHAPYLFALGVVFLDDQLQIISDHLDPRIFVPKEPEVTVRYQRAACAEVCICDCASRNPRNI